MVKRMGTITLSMVANFIQQFPLSGNIDKPTVVKVTQFDTWAASMGYYSLSSDRDTIVNSRNFTRKRINYGACHKAWRDLGGDAYHVRVGIHGQTYLVQPTLEAFDQKVQKLPAQIASITKTKCDALEALVISGDLKKLPQALQLRIILYNSSQPRFNRDILHLITERQRELAMIKNQVRSISPLDENGIFQALLTTPDELEEG